jgi:hypothetical protein
MRKTPSSAAFKRFICFLSNDGCRFTIGEDGARRTPSRQSLLITTRSGFPICCEDFRRNRALPAHPSTAGADAADTHRLSNHRFEHLVRPAFRSREDSDTAPQPHPSSLCAGPDSRDIQRRRIRGQNPYSSRSPYELSRLQLPIASEHKVWNLSVGIMTARPVSS